MSVVGNEEEYKSIFEKEYCVEDSIKVNENLKMDFIYSEEYPTITKKRYVSENTKREELDKIFVINNIPLDMKIDNKARQDFLKKLNKNISMYDLVVLCDFGHGLIDKNTKELLETEAKFLAINCQTNSSNIGKNLITKYKRADAFSLDNRELQLAFSDYNLSMEEAFPKLAKHLGCGGWHTLGSVGAEVIDKQGNISKTPAFTLKVTDTIGAGDAFFALASLCAGAHLPWEIGSFLGNIAGALGANIVGNRESIEKVNVLKFASTLLNV